MNSKTDVRFTLVSITKTMVDDAVKVINTVDIYDDVLYCAVPRSLVENYEYWQGHLTELNEYANRYGNANFCVNDTWQEYHVRVEFITSEHDLDVSDFGRDEDEEEAVPQHSWWNAPETKDDNEDEDEGFRW